MPTLDERLDKVEHDIRRLRQAAAIIAGVAVVFGLSGAFGARILAGAKKDLAELTEDIEAYETRMTDLREREQRALKAFAVKQKDDFDRHTGERLATLGRSWRMGSERVHVHRSHSPKAVTVSFGGSVLARGAHVFAIARSTHGSPDTYSVSIDKVNLAGGGKITGFTAKICRVDHHHDIGGSGVEGGCFSWSGDVQLDWIAGAWPLEPPAANHASAPVG